ncbi:MAG: hypothetical protein CMF58_06420 [Lentimicrobiaceae bacterium]|jgi:hypothetical protein|nr:hypothetical protein [Lentimicrobiaceae bacterium]MDG1901783.1 hypothetical protein [Bacteroidales bacterium]MDG2081107.1 hypothetical protein [Bacteroidales bacterium]|tara:strand:- start:18436 stop:18849 length:414 start_codon:yes stop_codon:yes gene_type:complete
MINEKEIQNLGYDFWKIVKSGVNGSMAEHLFVNPGVLAPNGSWLKLEAHQELHRSLCDEVHEWVGDLSIKVLSENPERVQVNGIVHWEATIKENGNRIVSEVGEQWIIERGIDRKLRWTNYWSDSFTYAKGSAELVL